MTHCTYLNCKNKIKPYNLGKCNYCKLEYCSIHYQLEFHHCNDINDHKNKIKDNFIKKILNDKCINKKIDTF